MYTRTFERAPVEGNERHTRRTQRIACGTRGGTTAVRQNSRRQPQVAEHGQLSARLLKPELHRLDQSSQYPRRRAGYSSQEGMQRLHGCAATTCKMSV